MARTGTNLDWEDTDASAAAARYLSIESIQEGMLKDIDKLKSLIDDSCDEHLQARIIDVALRTVLSVNHPDDEKYWEESIKILSDHLHNITWEAAAEQLDDQEDLFDDDQYARIGPSY
jgi:hypothetical protein